MRAIIDADHLPTAVRYYRAFPGEPAQQLKDYISINHLDAVHHLTVESLLKLLDGYTSGGENEFLLVLHSDPNGLLLPVGTGPLAATKADKSVLNVIQLASIAFGLIEDSKDPNLAVNAGFLNAWKSFFDSAPNVNTAAMTQASGIAAQCAEAAKLCQLWIDAACKAMHTTRANLRQIAALATKVREADIHRLEFRSCRLGAGNGLKEVARFFGAMSFAPTVRTFYVHQPVLLVPNQTRLNHTARRLGTNSRRFTAAQGAAGPNDDVAFAIQVTRLADARYSSQMFSLSEQAIWNWVNRFITRLPTSVTVNAQPVAIATGHTMAHDLVVAGFWTPGSLKPFVFPGEPEYPNFIEGVF